MKSNKIWWREYRKRKHRPHPRNLSIETVIRNNFKEVLREYIENSSLAGVKQICDPNIFVIQRILRICFFCAMLGSIFYFLQYLWYGNIAKPLIVSMDSSNYPISSIDFPSVAICNFNRISKAAVENYVDKYRQRNHHEKDTKVFRQQLLQLGRLIDYSYNESILDDHLLSYKNNYNLIEIMKELSPPCDKMLIKCGWMGKITKCRELFDVQLTVRGHCCAFNHVPGYDGANRSESDYFQVKRQNTAGLFNGLNVVLDTMVDDYSYALYNMYGFEIFIFESSHFGDPTGGRVVQRIIQPNRSSFFEINSVKQVATREVRKYTARTRKCFFQDELKDKYEGLYSYSRCIMNCRIKAVQSLCKCTPFYYFPTTSDDHPICTTQYLRCLNKYVEKLIYLYPKNAVNDEGLDEEIQNALRCPDCLPDCELTRHFTRQSDVEPLRLDQEKEFFDIYLKDINMTNKSVLSVYQRKDMGDLNRLDIVFYWYEIVSNIGGFCGILVGFSIISILEILYFFVFRFYFNLYLFYSDI